MRMSSDKPWIEASSSIIIIIIIIIIDHSELLKYLNSVAYDLV